MIRSPICSSNLWLRIFSSRTALRYVVAISLHIWFERECEISINKNKEKLSLVSYFLVCVFLLTIERNSTNSKCWKSRQKVCDILVTTSESMCAYAWSIYTPFPHMIRSPICSSNLWLRIFSSRTALRYVVAISLHIWFERECEISINKNKEKLSLVSYFLVCVFLLTIERNSTNSKCWKSRQKGCDILVTRTWFMKSPHVPRAWERNMK